MAHDISIALRAVLQGPARDPLVRFGNRWLTRAEIKCTADALAEIFNANGLGEFTRVGFIGRNRPVHIAAFLELLANRRSIVLINPFQSARELSGKLLAYQLPAVVIDEEDWASPKVRNAASEMACLVIIIQQDGARAIRQCTDFQFDPAKQSRLLSEDNIALEAFTSGTTGEPKPTHYTYPCLGDMVERIAIFSDRQGQAPVSSGTEASLILYAPIVHLAGFLVVLEGATGRRLVCLEKFTPQGWYQAVKDCRIEMGPLPPAMLRMFVEENFPPEALSSLKSIRSGGAPVDEATRRVVTERYNIPILGVYGATEYGGPIAAWSLDDYAEFSESKQGSAGRLDPDVAKARIVDSETNERLDSGHQGILEVQVMRMGKQWIRTTDIASIDDDGFLYIHGRSDNAINRGGFKIPPTVIEDALREHPDVSDAVALPIPDSRLGEVPVAAVELKHEQANTTGAKIPSSVDLKEFLKNRLVSYQVPVQIKVVKTLPRVSIGKISRPAVLAMFDQ